MFGLGIWLLSAALLGAAVLVVHAALFVAVLRAERASTMERWIAILPPALPFIGWRVGLRLLPVFWGLLVVAYLILRAAR